MAGIDNRHSEISSVALSRRLSPIGIMTEKLRLSLSCQANILPKKHKDTS